ncbi:hypothetical protein KY329_01285, partial [Candidatus Woesearchaeota archaeon]|nr:hypothetical protein [Candidatus Woesearchaeota archaeon]
QIVETEKGEYIFDVVPNENLSSELEQVVDQYYSAGGMAVLFKKLCDGQKITSAADCNTVRFTYLGEEPYTYRLTPKSRRAKRISRRRAEVKDVSSLISSTVTTDGDLDKSIVNMTAPVSQGKSPGDKRMLKLSEENIREGTVPVLNAYIREDFVSASQFVLLLPLDWSFRSVAACYSGGHIRVLPFDAVDTRISEFIDKDYSAENAFAKFFEQQGILQPRDLILTYEHEDKSRVYSLVKGPAPGGLNVSERRGSMFNLSRHDISTGTLMVDEDEFPKEPFIIENKLGNIIGKVEKGNKAFPGEGLDDRFFIVRPSRISKELQPFAPDRCGLEKIYELYGAEPGVMSAKFSLALREPFTYTLELCANNFY